jgi:beta-galactosidase/beta-glucuronidase
MRIVAMNFEIIRATPAVAEFLVHVELEYAASGCEITGRTLGPRCPHVSTVEVAYPMIRDCVSDKKVMLRCLIPEPNLWMRETPFTYVVTVELRRAGEVVESRRGAVAFRSE